MRVSKNSSTNIRAARANTRSKSAALLTGTALGCTLLIGAAPALADNECGPAAATVTCAPGTYANGIRYATLSEALALNVPVGAVISTTGVNKAGIEIQGGVFDTSLTLRGSLSTSGDSSPGIVVRSDTGRIAIDAGSVTTSGGYDFNFELPSEGITAYSNTGTISIAAQNITVGGESVSALYAQTRGTADIDITTGQITSTSTNSVTLGVGGGRNITINSDSIQTNNQGISVGRFQTGDRTIVPDTAGLVTINSNTINIGGVASGSAINVSVAAKDVVINSGAITTGGTNSGGITVTGAKTNITSGSINASGVGISATGGIIGISATGNTTSTGAGNRSAIIATGTGNVTINNAGTATSAGTGTTLLASSTGGSASITSNVARNTGTGVAISAVGTNGATINSVSASAASTTNAIQAQATTAGNAVVTSGTLTGSAAFNSISAVSNNGSATITAASTVNTNAATNAFGLYANGLTGATVTAGSVDAQGRAIRAQSGNGNVSVTTTGDVTSRSSNAISISGSSFDVTTAAGTTITSNGGTAAIAGGAFTGNGSVINNGTVAARGIAETGIGITTTGNATVVSNIVTVEGTTPTSGQFASGGISAISNGGGNVTVTSNTATVHGASRHGIVASAVNDGAVTVTSGTASNDASGFAAIQATTANGDVAVTAQNTTTTGDLSDGIFASSTSGDVAITAGTVVASGDGAAGVRARTGAGTITINTTDVTTSGDSLLNVGPSGTFAEGVNAYSESGNISIISGKTTVSGLYVSGVSAETQTGDITVRSAEVASTSDQAAAIGLYTYQAGDISLTSGIVNAVTAGLQVQSDGDIDITSTTVNTGNTGIYALVTGDGDITIDSRSVATTLASSRGILASGNAGSITVTSNSVSTQGAGSAGIQAQSGGEVTVNSTSASTAGITTTTTNPNTGVATTRFATAIRAISRNDDVSVTSGTATTTGAGVGAIYASGFSGVTIDAGSVSTSGVGITGADGIYAYSQNGDVSVDVDRTQTLADVSTGVSAYADQGDISINAGSASTAGYLSDGVYANAALGDVSITAGTVVASGDGAAGVRARTGAGTITINATDVTTRGNSLLDLGQSGTFAEGVNAYSDSGNISINSGKTTTSGLYSSGVSAETQTGNITVRSAEVASTSGDAAAIGLFTYQGGDISVTSGLVNAVAAGIQGTSVGNLAITSTTVNSGNVGINAVATGAGNVMVNSGSVATTLASSRGILATANAGSITLTSGTVTTQGAGSAGIQAQSGGRVTVTSNSASTAGLTSVTTNPTTGVMTTRYANAIRAISRNDAVSVSSNMATTTGNGVGAIYASGQSGLTLNVGTATASGAEVGTDDLIAVYGQTASGPTTANFNGAVLAANGFGAWLNASGAGPVNVTVASTGSITGLRGGLEVDTGTGAITVTNFGRIEATGTILNERTLSALDIGSDNAAVGAVVNNYGTIISRVTDTALRGSAISFNDLASNDTLNLYTGSNIVGSVEMFGGTDTVNLFGTALTKTNTQVVGNIFGSEVLNVATGYWTTNGGIDASAVNIVAGATLDIGAAPAVGQFASIANNGTLAFSLTDALTYSGTISGTGKLLKLGTNALTLSGANTYTGGTTVVAGTLILASDLTSNTVVNAGATLQIGTGGTTGSLIGDLVANGTVIFDRSGNYLLAGALSGNGSLIKRGAGLLTLDGVYAFTGTTSILGGTLKITQLAAGSELELSNGATVDLSGGQQTVGSLSGGSGSTVNIEDATLTVSQTGVGTVNTFGGSLTGDGALVVDGTGNFVLTGNNTYTGPTTVNGGLLTVNGSINSPTTVTDGGILGGSGQINGLVNITSGGTLSPGNSPGTLNIAGPLTLASGSTLAIEVDPTLAINHDQVNVTGTATIVNGAKLQVKPLGAIGNYARTQSYTILNATGGVTGRFAAGDISTTMALLTPTLSYTSNAVTLRLLRNDITFNSLAIGSNQRAVATAAEASGIGAAAYEALVTQSATGAQAGYDSLSGEAFGSTGSLLLNQSRHQREALLGHAALAEGPGAWFQVLGATNHINATPISGRARDEETGIAGGADTTVGDWTVGLSLSYRQSDIEVASRGSQSDVDTFSGGLYAGTDLGGLRVGGGFDYARHEVDSTRAIAFPSVSQTVTGNYDAETQQVFVEASYPTTLAGAAFEPFGSVAGVKFKSDAFSETGGTLALNVAPEDRDVVLTDLGARISFVVDAGETAIYPKLSLAWRHASGDIEGTSTAAFGTTPFTVRGGDLAEDSAVINAGASIDLGRNGKAWLTYSGVLADDSTSNGVMLGASFSF